ncbi:MAG: MarR family transcriptional regulator [Deltaproteobacteria bacterium]|nr:MAG: MarR family transcriptional regulator [Deltaproteobacteria bacterium]
MPAKDKGLALKTFIKLMRASASISARSHRPLADEGVSESQFGVLEALYQLGPLCRRDLIEKILKTGGNITLVVDNLEKHGLVERTRSSADRRRVTIALTPKGREVIERVYPKIEESISREMSILKSEEMETLSALLKKVGLGEHRAG